MSYVAIAIRAAPEQWSITFPDFPGESTTVTNTTSLVDDVQKEFTRLIQRWTERGKPLPPAGINLRIRRGALAMLVSAEPEPGPPGALEQYILLRVPDTSAPGFAEEARRQSRLIAEAEQTDEVRAEAEAWFDISDKTGWTP
jgi:hypothetical protein